jgi:ferrous iron transport protein A
MGQKLSDIKPGRQGRIVGFASGDRSYRQRLLAMGATPGTAFEVLRVAPLGDPYEILLRGFTLSLRKHESEMLIVEELA